MEMMQSTMLRRSMVAAVLVCLGMSSSLFADFIRVSQRTTSGLYTSGTYNVLGNIQVYTHSGSMEDYYNYASASGHPSAPPLSANTSNLFFVQASDGLGLFQIHGLESNASQGNNVRMRFEYDSTSNARFFFRDDTNDDFLVDGNVVTNANVGSTFGNTFVTRHNWDNNTDGAIIGALSTSWTIYASFQNIGANTNLSNWLTYSNDGSNSSIHLTMNNDQWVRFDYVVVPVPAGIVSAGIGIALVGLMLWRKRAMAAQLS
jgi:hypothetical protein